MLLLFIFSLYNFEVFDFLVINAHLSCSDLNLSSINLLLSNNLNKYHPFIFYISVFITTPPIFNIYSVYGLPNLFSLNYFCTCIRQLITSTLLINLFALFLGSWWALQEGTWGGWWNWDASEVLGLLISLISLQNIHSNILFCTVSQWADRFVMTITLLVLSYFFIQLNFDLVSHNFGSKFFFFFNNNLFFIELVLMLSYKLTSLSQNLYLNWSQLVILVLHGKGFMLEILQWSVVLALYCSVLIILGSSFLPLLNYFVWSYFAINSFNFHVYLPMLVASVLISLFLTFPSHHLFLHALTLSVGIWTHHSSTLLLLLLAPIRGSFISVVHLSLLIMVSVNITSYSISFVYWYPFMVYEELHLSETVSYVNQSLLVCDMFFVDKSMVYQSSEGGLCTSSWNTCYNTNSLNLNSFVLLCDSYTYGNYYNLSDGWLSPSLFIETNYLNNLMDILVLTTLVTTSAVSSKGYRTLY